MLPDKGTIRSWFALHWRFPDSKPQNIAKLSKRAAKRHAKNKVAKQSRKRNRR